MMSNATALETTMHVKNRRQARVMGWLTQAQYWVSPEGQRRIEELHPHGLVLVF